MEKTSLLKAIPLSFFSVRLYQEVYQYWGNLRSFIYLFVLLGICWVFVAFTIIPNLLNPNFLKKEIDHIANQMPTIHFDEGDAFTEQPGPFFIKTNNDNLLVIVDTESAYQRFKQSSALVLISKNEAFIKFGKSQISSYSFPYQWDRSFGPEEFKQFLYRTRKVITIISVLLYPVGLFFLYLYQIIQGLIYGIMGLFFSIILQRKNDYGSSINLSIMAMTPAIVLQTTAILLRTYTPFLFILSLFISVLYLAFAIKTIPIKE